VHRFQRKRVPEVLMPVKFGVLFMAGCMAAEVQAPQSKPIPAVLYAEVYRARMAALEAQHELDAALSAVVEYCGDKYSVSIDISDSKKNVCIIKPDGERTPTGSGTSGAKTPGL
jgi:hypothetical protein